MPVLNTADKVMAGGVLANAVYSGTTKVWPPAPSCTDVLREPFNNLSAWTLAGAPPLVAGRTGTAVQTSGTQACTYTIPVPSRSNAVTVGMAYRISTAGAGAVYVVRLQEGAGIDHVVLYVNTNGSLEVRRGTTTLIGTSAAGLLSTGVWAYIEMQTVVHDTAGSVVVRVNGSPVLTLTGVDTFVSGTGNVDAVRLGTATGGIPQFDDLYISTGAGCTFKGDQQVFNDNVLWEPFNNFTDNAWNTAPAVAAIVAGRTGTAAQLTSGEIIYTIPTAKQTTSLTVGFAFRLASVGVQRNILQLRGLGGASTLNTLRVNADGSLQVHAGSAITGGTSAAGVISAANTWYYVELKITFSNTAGAIEGRVNGTTVFGGSATVDTNGGFTDPTAYDAVALIYAGVTADFDDMYLTTGGGPFKGDPNPPATPSHFTGGVVTDVSTYRYHTFNTSGTLTFVPGDGPVSVEYLVVAGGGGGARGGGGAGGLLASTASLSASQTVTIGAGGATTVAGNPTSLGAISVAGGGRAGGATVGDGGNGGSGGGGGAIGGTVTVGGTASAGFAGGGVSPAPVQAYVSAGGGGAGQVGGSTGGTTLNTGKGGDGVQWPAGSGTYYAGGGGGGAYSDPAAYGGSYSAGGLGGGGAGAATAVAGTPNTGGGGGGTAANGGVGGSGKVVVRYLKKAGMPDPTPPPFNPLSIPWASAFWASDPSWVAPADGGLVSSWRDAGTSAVAANNATTTQQPIYRASYANLNGKPAIDFDGVDDWLLSGATVLLAQPNHVYAIGWLDSTHGASPTIIDGGVSGSRHLTRNLGASGGTSIYANTTSVTVTGAGRYGAFSIAALYNDAASKVRTNGTDYAAPASPGVAGLQTILIGTTRSQPANVFKGGIAFVGVSDTALTTQQITDLENWAKTFYGVPIP